ncbi:hypothetical protein D3C83_39070 [compost metagenome]
MPVKTKVKSAVAIASWMSSPANTVSAGISRTPPMPTAPISMPTTRATGTSQRMSSMVETRIADSTTRDASSGAAYVAFFAGDLSPKAARLPAIRTFSCFMMR